MHYGAAVKFATIPWVEPELRRELEKALTDGESLSEFVENSVRDSVRRRRTQAEFVARGMASLAAAKRTGDYVEAADTLRKLDAMLAEAKAKKAKTQIRRKKASRT
jgi:hypothetical protein